MAFLTWSDKYSVGVQGLDDQHAALVAMLNDFEEATTKGQEQSITGPLLRKLVNYTINHFAAEEAMLKATHYPGLVQHRAIHHELTAQVEEYVARFDRDDATLYPQLLNFLRDWLLIHIQQEDRDGGLWMNGQGVY